MDSVQIGKARYHDRNYDFNPTSVAKKRSEHGRQDVRDERPYRRAGRRVKAVNHQVPMLFGEV